jgi:hypothetical protein
MGTNNIFWMVYVEGKNTPTRKYENELDAIHEAERLTNKEGLLSYILKAEKVVAPIKKTELIELSSVDKINPAVQRMIDEIKSGIIAEISYSQHVPSQVDFKYCTGKFVTYDFGEYINEFKEVYKKYKQGLTNKN